VTDSDKKKDYSMKLPDDSQESDGPNLTPVIDVVFLLLIFFLVATEYAQEELDLKVNLPEVTQAQPVTMTPQLIVNVTSEGKYKVVREEYNLGQLQSILTEARENNPQQTCLIRGDGDSMLKYAVQVMDVCNKADMDYQIAAIQKR
jgi:biopolymer transport protein ExbD